MKKVLLFALACVLAATGSALADREVRLPNSRYSIDVPDWMRYSAPEEVDGDMQAYVSEMLEIDYTSYRKEEALTQGMPDTLRETAQKRAAAGADTELRNVNGIEMLCFRAKDETDGAFCIGYVFEDGEWLVEVDFWYASEEAARLTADIISTIH